MHHVSRNTKCSSNTAYTVVWIFFKFPQNSFVNINLTTYWYVYKMLFLRKKKTRFFRSPDTSRYRDMRWMPTIWKSLRVNALRSKSILHGYSVTDNHICIFLCRIMHDETARKPHENTATHRPTHTRKQRKTRRNN